MSFFFNFKFLVDKFPGVEGDCSDYWWRWIEIVLLWAVCLSRVMPVMSLLEL